jgi:hypothetical protein
MNLLVVTPTLGSSPWLNETIASVRGNAPQASHLLVAPAPAVATLRAQFPQIAVATDPGGGMYAAINSGAAINCEWDAITYINDDDLLLPPFADLASIALQGDSALSPLLVYGQVRLIDAQTKSIGRIPVSPFPGINRFLYAQRLEPVYQHGTILTRAAWDQLGGFDPSFRLCGDSELLARACFQGIPVRHVRKVVAAFRLHGKQLTKSRSAMLEERQRVDEKLHLLPSSTSWKHLMAALLFRLANIPVYAGRIMRHGWAQFDDLLEREA